MGTKTKTVKAKTTKKSAAVTVKATKGKNAKATGKGSKGSMKGNC